MQSVRKSMLDRLRSGPASLAELARELGLRDRESAEHLEHAAKSLQPGERLREEPAECLACGFTFRKRGRFSTPGRCPRCKSERIRPARFRVEGPA